VPLFYFFVKLVKIVYAAVWYLHFTLNVVTVDQTLVWWVFKAMTKAVHSQIDMQISRGKSPTLLTKDVHVR
jgi:hypothetical protein